MRARFELLMLLAKHGHRLFQDGADDVAREMSMAHSEYLMASSGAGNGAVLIVTKCYQLSRASPAFRI
jgi:hypothetical protein